MTKTYHLYVEAEKYTTLYSVEECTLAAAARKALAALPDARSIWDPHSGTEIAVNGDRLSAYQNLDRSYTDIETYRHLVRYQRTNPVIVTIDPKTVFLKT